MSRPYGGTYLKAEAVAATKSNGDKRFRFWAKIEGILVRILINSGSSRDLIKPEFVRKHNLPTINREPYAISNFDGTIIGTIKNCTKALNLRIGRRYKRHLFDLVLGGVDDITLGNLWLMKA